MEYDPDTADAAPRAAAVYTDAPALHAGLILGSLHLLFWCFVHPSAWCAYIRRLSPALRPDFVLPDITAAHWRSPAIRRLLIRALVITPLLSGLLVFALLQALGVPVADAIFSVGNSVMAGLVFALVLSLTVGVAAGMVGCIGSSIGTGLVFGLAYQVGGSQVATVMISGVAVIPVDASASSVVNVVGITYSLASAFVSGIIGSVAGRIATGTSAASLLRQTGSIVIGMAMSVLWLGLDVSVALSLTDGVLKGLVYGVVYGLAIGTAVWVASGRRAWRWRQALAVGVVICAVEGLAVSGAGQLIAASMHGLAAGIASGTGGSMWLSSSFALSYVLARRVAGSWAGVVAGVLAMSGACVGGFFAVIWIDTPSYLLQTVLPLSLACVLLGLSQFWWRPMLSYPLLAAWNTLLYTAEERRVGRPSLLRWHSAFWDEQQQLPLPGLEDHLLLVVERSPAEGQAALEYLATSRQGWAAQRAHIEMDARRLERCADIEALRQVHRAIVVGDSQQPASPILRRFSRMSRDVDVILGDTTRSTYNQRLALEAVEERLDTLLHELIRSGERHTARFRPIVERWRRIVDESIRRLVETVEQHQELDSPYIVGVPLTEQETIFVGRTDISTRIESLLLDRGCPPLFLYGQRRMGKTSLLNNLGRLLPSTTVPLFVDLQGPAAQADSHAGLLYNLARSMIGSALRQRELVLPPLPYQMLSSDPFTRFDEWLDDVERVLGARTALLALDEFEALDSALSEGRFSQSSVLGMLRHIIQHRPRFKILLSGSHTLAEMHRWASYLINVQVVHISCLQESEARQLIERPIKHFALRYLPEASQRVLDLTQGHPALIQLLCAEIISLKNRQDPDVRRLARLMDVEAAVPEALRRGSFFFADIERSQVDPAGRALLRLLARLSAGHAVSRAVLEQHVGSALDAALPGLIQREIIVPVADGYRFHIELVRRWFALDAGLTSGTTDDPVVVARDDQLTV